MWVLVAVKDSWYSLDTNSIDPVYVLKELRSVVDSDFWSNALPKLRKLLDGCSFDQK